MGDMSMRSTYPPLPPPLPLPFLFGGQHTPPASRPGIFLRGPNKKQRLIQLPATFEDLVIKAANVFSIDRAANDIVIVLADDELTEIEEDSLPVLHEREILLVKVVPRQPKDDTAMQIADSRSHGAAAGPSQQPLHLALPPPPPEPSSMISFPHALSPLIPQTPSALALELIPAPLPGLPDRVPEDDEDPGFLAPPSSLETQSHRRLSLTPLTSAMKVKTCPMQAQNTAGPSQVQVHTSLNSAIGRSAPLTRSTSSAGFASRPSPLTNKRKAEQRSDEAGASNAPARRKRDVRKERKKHAEQTIARERAAMEAETAAAAAVAAAALRFQEDGLSGSSTPSGSQSRRRIAFALPADSSDEEMEKLVRSDGSKEDGPQVKEEQGPKAHNAADTAWDLEDDDSDGSAESPAKRRKLNVEAAQAARIRTIPLPSGEQPPSAPLPPASAPSLDDAPQETMASSASASTPTLLEAEAEANEDSNIEIVPVEPPADSPRKPHKPVTRSKTASLQVPTSDRSPYLEISSSSSSNSDSEEDGINAVSPARKSADPEEVPTATTTSIYRSAEGTAAADVNLSPSKRELTRGRPSLHPEERAECERTREDIRQTTGKSPRKGGPRSRVGSASQSPRLDKSGSDNPTDSQAASDAAAAAATEDESPARSKRMKGKGARSFGAPSPTPGRANVSSEDVVHETPPDSPVQAETPSVSVVIPTLQMTSFKGSVEVQTPPPSVLKLPKKAPVSRGGTAISAVLEHVSQSASPSSILTLQASPELRFSDLADLDDLPPLSSPDSPMEVDDLTASVAHASTGASTPESNQKKAIATTKLVKTRSSLSPDDALKRYSANLMMAAASNEAHRAITAIQTAQKASSRSPSPAFARSNSTSPVAGRAARVTSAPEAQEDSTSASPKQAPSLLGTSVTAADGGSQATRIKLPNGPGPVDAGEKVSPHANNRGLVSEGVVKGVTNKDRAPAAFGIVVPRSNPGTRARPRHSAGPEVGADHSSALANDTKVEQAYKTASSLIESVFKHPSNDFIKPASAKDLSNFLRGHPEGGLNLLAVRQRIQQRDFHGPRYARSGTENEPLANLETDMNRMWANMSSFFGQKSRQAKNVGELSNFTKGMFREWRAVMGGGGLESSGAVPGKGRSIGTGTPAQSGADALRRANGNGPGPGSRSDTPTQLSEGNGKRAGRNGGASGRSTPVLDAKAIQNAARNGGQLPSALGLTSSSLMAHQKSMGGAPLRVRGTGSNSSSDSASGSPAFQSWLAKNMPANKAGGPPPHGSVSTLTREGPKGLNASSAGTGGRGSVAAADVEDAGMPTSSPVSSRQAATMPWFPSSGKTMVNGANTIPASIPAPPRAINGTPSSILDAFTGVLKSVTHGGGSGIGTDNGTS